MKKYLLPIIFGLLCGFAVKSFVSTDNLVNSAVNDKYWGKYNYKIFDRDFTGDLDLKISGILPDNCSNPACRILLAYEDKKNYSAIDFSEKKAVFRKISQGVILQQREADFSLVKFLSQRKQERSFRIRYLAHNLKFIADNSIQAIICDIDIANGRAGIGTVKGNVELKRPEILQIAPIAFRDDFMRGVKDVSVWQRSSDEWQVRSIENPSRSSNAFVYYCKSEKGSISVLGRDYWDNYLVSTSFFGSFNTQAGLVFAEKDKENYMLFRWSSAAKDRDGKASEEKGKEKTQKLQQNVLQILKVEDGKEKILSEKKHGYQPNRWYRMSIKCGEGIVKAYIDNIKVMENEDSRISGGRAGLFARGKNAVEFDDFKVKSQVFPARVFAVKKQITAKDLKAAADSSNGAIPFIFNKKISGYTLDFSLKPEGKSEPWQFSIIPVFSNALSYYSFEISGNNNNPKSQLSLCKVEEGKRGKNLISDNLYISTDFPLQIKFKSGILSISQQDKTFYTGFAGSRLARAAFSRLANCVVENFKFKEHDYSLPVASINQVFDEEKLMKSWSGHGGDWRKSASGPYDSVYWHRAYFFGNTEIEALLFNTGKGQGDIYFISSKTEILLSLAKPVGSGKKGNGYTAKYSHDKDKKSAKLELMKNGKCVSSKEFKDTLFASRLRFRKSGPILAFYINDKLELLYKDSKPLNGKKVAWAEKGISVPVGNVRVYNDNLKSYSFNSAPVDWIIGSGIWEVTNRWECDPRWSFWSGMPSGLAERRIAALGKYFSERSSWKLDNLKYQLENVKDKKDRHVVLWHKDNFEGDLLAEFYVGQMMDRGRSNSYSKYVRDFNITICSDGKSLLDGYSCILGGWKNKKSAIMRNGEIVVEKSGNVLMKGYVHRRWIRVRVTRSGEAIRFTADYETKTGRTADLLDLYYVDKNPLKGKRIALWSYDCGILIGRFRVSAEKITPPDSPFNYNIFNSKSIYTIYAHDE